MNYRGPTNLYQSFVRSYDSAPHPPPPPSPVNNLSLFLSLPVCRLALCFIQYSLAQLLGYDCFSLKDARGSNSGHFSVSVPVLSIKTLICLPYLLKGLVMIK
jgi:hypothetical protein